MFNEEIYDFVWYFVKFLPFLRWLRLRESFWWHRGKKNTFWCRFYFGPFFKGCLLYLVFQISYFDLKGLWSCFMVTYAICMVRFIRKLEKFSCLCTFICYSSPIPETRFLFRIVTNKDTYGFLFYFFFGKHSMHRKNDATIYLLLWKEWKSFTDTSVSDEIHQISQVYTCRYFDFHALPDQDSWNMNFLYLSS